MNDTTNFIARDHDRRVLWKKVLLWLGDVSAALLALWLADALRRVLPFGAFPDRVYLSPQVILLVVAIWSAVFYFWGAYERRRREERTVELRTVFLATTFALFTLAAAFYFFKVEDFSRLLFLYFYLLDLGLGLGARLLFRALQTRARPSEPAPRRALIIGADATARELAEQIATWPHYTLLGFIGDEAEPAMPAPVLGRLDDALRLIHRLDVDDVFISQIARGRAELADLILALRDSHVRVRLLPDLLELITVRTGIETLRGVPLITLREPAITGLNGVLKRILDVVGATLGLVLFSPLMLVIAILIKLDSPGPVLFAQMRAGQYGKPFRIYKFRTMVPDAEAQLEQLVDLDALPTPYFKLRNDPRVTRVGRWLRRTSLDELPQLWNVLTGSMSLVGPRPEVIRIAAKYSPTQRQRLLVKPGLTGAMQISGRADLSFDERTKLELDYIENYSIWRDLFILAKTIPAVLSGKGAY